jgi:hypothetical protein
MNTSLGRRRPGAVSTTSRAHSAAAPEAREQRAREQKRRTDELGELRLDVHRVDPGGTQRQLVGRPPGNRYPQGLEDREHRLHVADARHIAHQHLVLGEQARREDG